MVVLSLEGLDTCDDAPVFYVSRDVCESATKLCFIGSGIILIGIILLIIALLYYYRRKNPVEDISEYEYSEEW